MKKMIAFAFFLLQFHSLYSETAFSKGDNSDTLSDAKRYVFSEKIIPEDYAGKDNFLWVRIPKITQDSLLHISGIYSECRVYSENELIKTSNRFISDIPSHDLFDVSGADGLVYVKIKFSKIEKLNFNTEFIPLSGLSKLSILPDYFLIVLMLLSLFSLVLVIFIKTDKKKVVIISFLFSLVYLIPQLLANKSFYDTASYFSYFSFASLFAVSCYFCSKNQIYKSFPVALFTIVLTAQYFGNYIPEHYIIILGVIPFLTVFLIFKDDKIIEKIMLITVISLIPVLHNYYKVSLSVLSVCSVFLSLILISLVSVLRLIVFHSLHSQKFSDTDAKIKLLVKENENLYGNLKSLNDERISTENTIVSVQKIFSEENYFSSGWECRIISDSKYIRTDAAAFVDCGSYSVSYIFDIEGHSIEKSMLSLYLKQEIFKYLNKHNEKLTILSAFLQNLSDKLGLNYLRGIVVKINGDYAECINYSYPDCYYINGRAQSSGKLSFIETEKNPVVSGYILKNESKMYKINSGDYLIMVSDSLRYVMDDFISHIDFSGGINNLCRRLKKAFSAVDFNDDITIVILQRNQ
ncbi:MAG: hypothetical protein KA015_03770 [Spirochaetes bacterium]|nr:hypothetical protein [Spirochaetota bacterium]